MKANEFVKENGIEKCKRIFDDLTDQGHTGYFYKDLKRLVGSHELVMDYYGLARAKEYADSKYTAPELKVALKQAIADVQGCL